MKLSSIFKGAAVLLTVCTLLLSSCEKPANVKEVPEVSIKNQTVASGKGQQFVNVKCGGDWTLALVSEDGEVEWATLNTYSGSGNQTNVKLSYDVNATEKSRELTICLDNGSKTVSCSMLQLPSGQHPEDDPDTGGDNGSGTGDPDQGSMDFTKTGWLELPAMDDPDLRYYAHHFEMNGKSYRNYSFGWSNENYLAVWVAYPLCKMYTNGSNSGGDWEANPLFSSDYQPNFTKSFGFSQGYERGHQIANADRKCCYEANQQTYYFTNATLQHKDFNGPVWGVLEGNMRGAANSADTLYVVTGCVLPKSPRYITDYDGHKVPIPSGYFKAALRYHKASTQSVWMGAAFYLDHDASKYSSKQITKSESMSIAELEDKLGMDFFVNLPAMVGADKAAAIENQDPDTFSSVWGIR
jgi:DNA/RNA endonuclease G (NUC1)